MTINIGVPSITDTQEVRPRITVFGVGGAGGNAVNNMIQSELEGVDFVVANTDAQALALSRAERRVQLGLTITQGLGAGSRPDVGRAAAEEATEEIVEHLRGAHMAFITAGMGGGTGTGAAPIVAGAAREQGILTVGVVTKPFDFEGPRRKRIADQGIEEMERFVDALIVIPNQNLFRIANEKTTFADAFAMADDVLYSGVRGVTDLMAMPGLINLDFADIRAIMSGMGMAMMGTGESEGERRALEAASAAIFNPLLDDISLKGATSVLINLTGGPDMTLFEVDEAANRVRSEVDGDAYIVFGSSLDDGLDGKMRVSIVATGMRAEAETQPGPTLLDVVAAPETAGPGGDAPAAAMELGTVVAMRRPADEAGTAAAEAPKPAAATPAAKAVDAFIPPAPADPRCGESPRRAEPFAAAAMTNGAGKPKAGEEKPSPGRARPSLFERVTGTGRAAKPAKLVEEAGEAGTEAPPADESAAAGESEETAAEQAVLGGLDLKERLAGSRSGEDLLDIPAFLRRQVN